MTKTPKADALRAMREANFEKRRFATKVLDGLRREVAAIPAVKPPKVKGKPKAKRKKRCV